MAENKYDLKVTPAARDDLAKIYHHIACEIINKSAADKLMDKIQAGFMRLSDFPFSCNYVNDVYLKNKGYRKLIIDNFIGLYIVDKANKQVIIMRVIFGRQNYRNKL